MVRQIRLFLSSVALLLLVAQRGLSADNVQFTGSLVAVTPHSVWVKEANGVLKFARLPDEGAISAPVLAGRYKIGDQVLIKGTTVKQFRDDEEDEWFDLEAKSLDYLRPASAAELASALASPARRRKSNLLRSPAANDSGAKSDPPVSVSLKTLQLPDASVTSPAKDSPAAILERSRDITQEYLKALPNFNADETSRLYYSPVSNPPKWQLDETLESEVSFRGTQAVHRNVARNGKPWSDLFEHLPPAPRAGQQHGLLRNAFDANCMSLEFAKRMVEAGIPVLVYRIAAPPDSCVGGGWGLPGERYYPRASGEIAIAEADGLMRRLEITTAGYPKGYPTQQTETRATWDYVRIGEERHLLPVEVQVLHAYASGGMRLSVTTFKNHRHFETFTNLTYK